MKKMFPVVHFEMPADDRNRMADFYGNVFGWKAQFFGEDMGNYVTVATGETDEKGHPKMPGIINGGFYLRENAPESHPSVVIAVDDIEASMKAVTAAGGQVIGEPMQIPGVGKFVPFIDTEGNKNSILQPSME